jgi:hypothetical protein
MASTILLFIIDERCSQHTSKSQVRAPKAEIAVAVSQSTRKHLELLGPEGTGFEKRPETNQQVKLQFDNTQLRRSAHAIAKSEGQSPGIRATTDMLERYAISFPNVTS